MDEQDQQGGQKTGGESGGMGMRGVTRPMPMHEHHQRQQQDRGESQQKDGEHQHHHEHDGEHQHKGHMSHEHRMHMLHMHHKQTLWCYWALVLLGVWLCLAPFTFGYLNPGQWVHPSGGRGPWFMPDGQTADELRAQLMTWSDVVSGLVLIFFGWRGLRPNRPISLWICCLVGMWVTLAPVVFWAPTAAAYLSDTIVGMLVIALSVLIPGMPNMIMYMQHGGATPPGWSYNPSSWPQRWIMIATGFAGFVVSRYLAAFQLGYITHAFDPFFGQSTVKVLNSKMSHMWPISDGALGTLSYTFEFMMGFMGAPTRWRTMPWMVTFFGILVIPLGLTHIFLVISQPVVVGEWCTFCLLAAAIMLPMIPLEVDEVVAMGQHLVQAKRRGDRGGSLWKIFWFGGSGEDSTEDERSPEMMELSAHPLKVLGASVWGMSVPWMLAAGALVGIWFMFQPAAMGNAGEQAATIWTVGDMRASTADVFHLAGALILTTSVIAMGEVVRSLRWLNLLLGAIVATLPWLSGGQEAASSIIGTIGGAAVIALSIPRGPVRERYGSWQRFIR